MCSSGKKNAVSVQVGEGLVEKHTLDVVEAPTRMVPLKPNRSKIRYGTVGNGLDLARLVWPYDHHVFSSQSTSTQELRQQLPGRRLDVEVGPPRGVPRKFLRRNPVDVLVIDGEDFEVWGPWLEESLWVQLPRSIVWSVPASVLESDGEGPMGKSVRKAMGRLKYAVQYWTMWSDQHDAALVQERVVAVYTKVTGSDPEGPVAPEPSVVPARGMSNLLLPVGVPYKAYARDLMGEWHGEQIWVPCRIVGQMGRDPVFDRTGPMPDLPSVWVESERGVRRLQHEELAKAKGAPSEWFKGEPRKATKQALVEGGTCVHIWAAALDAIATWLDTMELDPTANPMTRPGVIPSVTTTVSVPCGNGTEPRASPSVEGRIRAGRAKAKDSNENTPVEGAPQDDSREEEWSWSPPDLSEGGVWYTERITSLRQACSNFDEADELYQDGLAALKIHRENYGPEGPKYLQLLWWEFPEEHWEALRVGSKMNFLIAPSGELVPNSDMEGDEQKVAGKFVDELKSLGVLVEATEGLRANCPLFCVSKGPKQPGQWRCIADMKRGGQNRCIGKDPVYLSRSDDMLPQLYEGGWSAVADASKHFHNFPTHPDERVYMGTVHPITGEELIYMGLPMGSANSPAIACRVSNGALRQLRHENPLFHGYPVENSWRKALSGVVYHPKWGHGRVLLGSDGEPVALLWSMVDDYFVHATTKYRCGLAFKAFLDYTVRLGFICQAVKTSPPAQVQTFCGMWYDTTGRPRIRIPDEKVERGKATISYIKRKNNQGSLSRLALVVGGGFLQSLVDATPARQGQVYLRKMYDILHELEDVRGRDMYYTMVHISDECVGDLGWWDAFLTANPGNPSRAGASDTLTTTFGDGSGTGTGGTSETLGSSEEISSWMGSWSPHVRKYSSNWKELRTLLWTMERRKGTRQGGTLFYFTDNLVSYYIIKNGSSTSPELHELIRRVKLLEIELCCRLEVIHVPGTLMIEEGTDGLSRGVWLSAQRLQRSSLVEASEALGGIVLTPGLVQWVLTLAGIPVGTRWVHEDHLSSWDPKAWIHGLTVWTPTPETAHQALVKFLELWVEVPTTTSALFLIPRVLQGDWGHLCRSVRELGDFYPSTLPSWCSYVSLIPFVVLYVPRHLRVLPPDDRMELFAPRPTNGAWHQAQADELRGL